MSALPSNLLIVGEDLARATARDAERSLRRRRVVTLVVALAVLVVTATAAVANGWLLGQTTTLRAVPALGAGASRAGLAPGAAAPVIGEISRTAAKHRAPGPDSARAPEIGTAAVGTSHTLLTNLGPQKRVLSSVATTTGGVCLVLTDFPVQCIPTFAAGQHVAWIVTPTSTGTTLVWGIARDDVESIEAVSDDDTSTPGVLGNNGFYVEVDGAQPTRLVVHLSDGSSDVEPLFPCPPTTPSCAK